MEKREKREKKEKKGKTNKVALILEDSFSESSKWVDHSYTKYQGHNRRPSNSRV